jgi:small multidrug resistance pump
MDCGDRTMPWAFLMAAIVAELFGTLGLRGIAKAPTWWAIALIAVAYSVSFLCMAIALRHLNVGVVYAIWSAVGIAAISVAGALFFGEHLSCQAMAGMAVIVLGVAILLSSGSVRHA